MIQPGGEKYDNHASTSPFYLSMMLSMTVVVRGGTELLGYRCLHLANESAEPPPSMSSLGETPQFLSDATITVADGWLLNTPAAPFAFTTLEAAGRDADGLRPRQLYNSRAPLLQYATTAAAPSKHRLLIGSRTRGTGRGAGRIRQGTLSNTRRTKNVSGARRTTKIT